MQETIAIDARPARFLTARRVTLGASALLLIGAGFGAASSLAESVAPAPIAPAAAGASARMSGPQFRTVANTTDDTHACVVAWLKANARTAHGHARAQAEAACTVAAGYSAAQDAAFVDALRAAGMTVNDETATAALGHLAVDTYTATADRDATMSALDNAITGGTGVWPEVPPVQGRGVLPAIIDAALVAYGV
jgi:hypothetical protein